MIRNHSSDNDLNGSVWDTSPLCIIIHQLFWCMQCLQPSAKRLLKPYWKIWRKYTHCFSREWSTLSNFLHLRNSAAQPCPASLHADRMLLTYWFGSFGLSLWKRLQMRKGFSSREEGFLSLPATWSWESWGGPRSVLASPPGGHRIQRGGCGMDMGWLRDGRAPGRQVPSPPSDRGVPRQDSAPAVHPSVPSSCWGRWKPPRQGLHLTPPAAAAQRRAPGSAGLSSSTVWRPQDLRKSKQHKEQLLFLKFSVISVHIYFLCPSTGWLTVGIKVTCGAKQVEIAVHFSSLENTEQLNQEMPVPLLHFLDFKMQKQNAYLSSRPHLSL